MRSMKRTILIACKSVFCTSWTLFAAELFLRVLAPVAIVPRHVTATAYGIRGNEPNQRFWQTSSEYKIQIRTNSKGLRADEEIAYAKPPGVKRIVVLGDSFGMGFEVNLEDTFLERMRAELRLNGINIQIVNLSVSGFGNAEELIALREEGVKYHPDLVLLSWHVSDYTDNIRSALFAINDGQLMQISNRYLPGIRIQQFLSRFPIYQRLSDESQLYNFAREGVTMNILKPAMVFYNIHVSGKPEADRLADAEESGARDPYQVALSVAIMRKIQEIAHQAHAGFLVLDIPVCQDRYHYTSAFPTDSRRGHFGLPFVTPLSEFQAHLGTKLYYEHSDRHFTPRGCEIVGKLLADTIMANGDLGKASTSLRRNSAE